MGFDLRVWQERIAERAEGWKSRWEQARPAGVSSLYAFLSAMALWPVAEAVRQGEWAALVALGGVAAGVGGNLLANQIQSWKDEVDAATQLARAADQNEQVRAALDAVLERLDVVSQAQTSLGEADRIWFVQTLRREVSELGSELVMAAVGGSGPTAVGDRAAAAGAGGLAVGGDVGGPVIQARGDVTLGKSEKDDQYDAVLSWDGNRSLRYFDLSGRDLSGLKLVGADMHGAKLTRADLSGANLAHADLRKADLSGANLSHADISEAYMLRFRPLKAILDEDIPSDEQGRLMLEYFFGDAARPDLRGAILTRADLSEANLNGADLRIASLQRVTLRDATLRYADLRRADLSEADLRGADLRGADLRDADLRQANLEGAVVTNQQLDQASSLKGATMPDGTKYGLLNRLGRIFE